MLRLKTRVMHKKSRMLALFAVAGVIGYFVDAGVLLLLAPLVGPYWGRGLSFLTAVSTTWLCNRSLTFRSVRANLSLRREFCRYVLVCLGGGSVNLAAYSGVVHLFTLSGYWLLLAVAVGSLAGMGVNYRLSRRYVFFGRNK